MFGSKSGARSVLLVLISLVLAASATACTPAQLATAPLRATVVPLTEVKAAAAVAPVNAQAAPAVVASTAKPVFVEFYSTICAICKQIEPAIYQVQDEYQSRVEFKRYDVAGIDKRGRQHRQGRLRTNAVVHFGRRIEPDVEIALHEARDGFFVVANAVVGVAAVLRLINFASHDCPHAFGGHFVVFADAEIDEHALGMVG